MVSLLTEAHWKYVEAHQREQLIQLENSQGRFVGTLKETTISLAKRWGGMGFGEQGACEE